MRCGLIRGRGMAKNVIPFPRAAASKVENPKRRGRTRRYAKGACEDSPEVGYMTASTLASRLLLVAAESKD